MDRDTVDQQLRSSDKSATAPQSESNMDLNKQQAAPVAGPLADFVTIYKWHCIKPETPWNVQRFGGNQCQESKDFASYEKALMWANSFNLPVIYEHCSKS